MWGGEGMGRFCLSGMGFMRFLFFIFVFLFCFYFYSFFF